MIDFSPWPTETLETALRFQLERDPAAFIADCLRAELKLREAAAKTDGQP